MPMHINVSPLDRLLVGAATGDLTLVDLEHFFAEMVEGNLLHYRKIVDVAGCNPAITSEEMKAFGQAVRVLEEGKEIGPVAIVAGKRQAALAEQFVELTTYLHGRSANVFSSLHEARKWLEANTKKPS